MAKKPTTHKKITNLASLIIFHIHHHLLIGHSLVLLFSIKLSYTIPCSQYYIFP